MAAVQVPARLLLSPAAACCSRTLPSSRPTPPTTHTHTHAQAIDLEQVCKARQHGLTVRPDGQKGWWADLRWAYKCHWRPWVLRATAALMAATSAVVVWSEATIGTGLNPDLSPFSLMVRSGVHQDEFLVQLLTALPLGYMCACAYFSLLKLGNFSFYHVVRCCCWGGF